jgi:hypothetical protein
MRVAGDVEAVSSRITPGFVDLSNSGGYRNADTPVVNGTISISSINQGDPASDSPGDDPNRMSDSISPVDGWITCSTSLQSTTRNRLR